MPPLQNAINGSNQRCLGLMAFLRLPLLFLTSKGKKSADQSALSRRTLLRRIPSTPLTWGCELLFHVLRSGVPEIGARFLDLAARNAVAVPPKSIIVSAVIQRKPNTAVAATPKKSNNE